MKLSKQGLPIFPRMEFPVPRRDLVLPAAGRRTGERKRLGFAALAIGMLAAILTTPLPAQERKTIYVDRMEGLEPFVEKALLAVELPFDFIEEAKQPELKASLSRMHSAYGEILYKHKIGRNETHRLELRDVSRNKVIASHTFQLKGDDESRQREAREFAEKVKKSYGKERR